MAFPQIKIAKNDLFPLGNKFWISKFLNESNRFQIISNLTSYNLYFNTWSEEASLTLISNGINNIITNNVGGAVCKRYGMSNEYAAPSDSYICYNCRN